MKYDIEMKKNIILIQEIIKSIEKINDKKDLKKIYNYIKRLESN